MHRGAMACTSVQYLSSALNNVVCRPCMLLKESTEKINTSIWKRDKVQRSTPQKAHSTGEFAFVAENQFHSQLRLISRLGQWAEQISCFFFCKILYMAT